MNAVARSDKVTINVMGGLKSVFMYLSNIISLLCYMNASQVFLKLGKEDPLIFQYTYLTNTFIQKNMQNYIGYIHL